MDGPKAERRALEGARTRHQRPCRCPLRPEMAALASWATPAHASLMASSTMDDHLAVWTTTLLSTIDDAAVCTGAKHFASAMSLGVMDTGSDMC